MIIIKIEIFPNEAKLSITLDGYTYTSKRLEIYQWFNDNSSQLYFYLMKLENNPGLSAEIDRIITKLFNTKEI